MAVLDITDKEKDISFSGIEHRLFIEGRGFDFRTFEISHQSIAKLELKHCVIPFKIKRNLPNGKYEIWNLKELEIN